MHHLSPPALLGPLRHLGKFIEVQGDEGVVPTTRIQPIGLVVNELVTDAAKYGTGKIGVAYRIEGDVHELSVCDEGEDLPFGFDPDNSVRNLGMKVVTILAKQLGGRLTAGQTRPAADRASR